MSRIRADRYTNREGTGAPTFSAGVNVVGVTSMSGDLAVTNGTITGVSELSISGITSSISDTVVDVFVYDTSKDSDGGAWRKRTQNTSWYNETLGTATRGTRREFPAVAVIVAAANQVTIYDGDDPDLPLWITFPTTAAKGVTALNGELCLCSYATASAYHGLLRINFVADQAINHRESNSATVQGYFIYTLSSTDLAKIDDGPSSWTGYTSEVPNIVNGNCNDLAMTVLPNAPIDDTTGLPIPTIAVATNGGVSVIKDDGTVVNATGTGIYAFSKAITITEENYLWWLGDSYLSNDILRDSWAVSLDSFPTSNFTWNSSTDTMSGGTYYTVSTASEAGKIKIGSANTWAWNHQERNALGGPAGLAIHKPNIGSETNSLIVAITSDYNTGYMHGDIKLATLSDTDTTNLSGGTVADRSIKNNSVNVTGTITRTAVATGADLVAYSGFSASNYLQQPNNSDLAPGTGPYSVSCWIKTATDGSNDQYIFDRGVGGSNSRNLMLVMQTSGRIQFYNTNSSGTASDLQTTDMPSVADNTWHQIVALYDGGAYRVYIDGKASSVTNKIGRNVGNDGTPPLTIGTRFNYTQTFGGNLALFRYSRTAPSPEQIKKVYEDEKFLFQENSQATLYGSSDAVTALAYDDTTELLHVGTSAGRSEFQGLRRINNTTTAVTTALSASNELVAEQ
jgi:hypothetical protein